MNALGFTRIDTYFPVKKAYDINEVAIEIIARYPELREDAEYKDTHNLFIELTMSCDIDEAIRWMEHWMSDAIGYGIATKEKNWKMFFLASYDLYNHLKEY